MPLSKKPLRFIREENGKGYFNSEELNRIGISPTVETITLLRACLPATLKSTVLELHHKREGLLQAIEDLDQQKYQLLKEIDDTLLDVAKAKFPELFL